MDVELPPAREGAYDELLSSAPRTEDVTARLQRANVEYINKDERFMRDARGYGCQYAQIYFQRLTLLKRPLGESASKEWPGVPITNILELKSGETCCVMGTLFKEMKLKPSIMSEYSSDPAVAPALAGAKLTDQSDSLVMEDEGARMSLAAAPGLSTDLSTLVTGTIAAVRGKDNEGVFEVEAILFAGMPPQPPLPSRDDDAYVALISGIDLGKPDAIGEGGLRVQLAIDYLTGLLGSPLDQETSAKVVRVVLAGGIIGDNETLASAAGRSQTRSKAVPIGPVKDADLVLTQLAAGVPVDVMPGASDPATASLPQQPMHRCLLPGAAAFPTVTRATNPHAFEVGGVTFLGSAGQTIDDIFRYSSTADRLDILSSTLDWRHMCPTSPDTLPTFPFPDRDPFILDESPHCYFVGNQPEFATRNVKGPNGQAVRLVLVPRFQDQGTIVLVNLRTMACRTVHFATPMLHD